MNCAENPFKRGTFLQQEVSFKMGAFSDTQHTHPGIFKLESPPWVKYTQRHIHCVYSNEGGRYIVYVFVNILEFKCRRHLLLYNGLLIR